MLTKDILLDSDTGWVDSDYDNNLYQFFVRTSDGKKIILDMDSNMVFVSHKGLAIGLSVNSDYIRLSNDGKIVVDHPLLKEVLII